MTTFVFLAAGVLIGARRGTYTLLISGVAVAIVTFAGSASEGLSRAFVRCIGSVFVLDAGFILAIAASVLLQKHLPNFTSQDEAGKARGNDAYGGTSRPRG